MKSNAADRLFAKPSKIGFQSRITRIKIVPALGKAKFSVSAPAMKTV
jgi:hypothetical protein